jgi:hypothetical protein
MRKAFAMILLAASASAQQTPTPAAAEWWRQTTALANDQMEGRDTGSEAYERAAKYVAEQFQAAGLKPAGDLQDGQATYFQRVPMHQVSLDTAHSSVELVDQAGAYTPLGLLYDINAPARTAPLTEGQLVFLGYGQPPAGVDLKGKIAVLFNNAAAGRPASLASSGIIATVTIDNPTITEPAHWPSAYTRSVSLAGAPARLANGPLAFRISIESAPKLFAGSGADSSKILADAERGLPIPSMPLARTLRFKLSTTEKDISSPNVLGILPGSDPTLAAEYVAVSAHLDGYGYGTPVQGDNLYNGALDDAAYVATLIEFATNLHGKGPRRSLLFAIFTGEEKGLLGSAYFTQHLTVPADKIVADLNLDQLRPIFPLKLLTMEGIADSTLGDTAKGVAATFGIELRPDHEPERRLFSRTDAFNFVKIGVPITGFVFGYNPGSEEERLYRDWYARRYHKPQDDLDTPIDWAAAVTFNNFYRTLVLAVANAPSRPRWMPNSPYAPKP